MLRRELKGPERRTKPKLRAAKDIDDATKIFMESFERPGIPHYEGRGGPRWRSKPIRRSLGYQLPSRKPRRGSQTMPLA
jgi:hypothetical protein